jgi:hypothetical protein
MANLYSNSKNRNSKASNFEPLRVALNSSSDSDDNDDDLERDGDPLDMDELEDILCPSAQRKKSELLSQMLISSQPI